MILNESFKVLNFFIYTSKHASNTSSPGINIIKIFLKIIDVTAITMPCLNIPMPSASSEEKLQKQIGNDPKEFGYQKNLQSISNTRNHTYV